MLAILSTFLIIVSGLLAGWAFIPHSFGQSKVVPTATMSPPLDSVTSDGFGVGQVSAKGGYPVWWADTEDQHLWAEPDASAATVAVEQGPQSDQTSAVATAGADTAPDAIAAGSGSAGDVTLDAGHTTAVASTPVCTMPSVQDFVMGTVAAKTATVPDTTAVAADQGLEPRHIDVNAASPAAAAVAEGNAAEAQSDTDTGMAGGSHESACCVEIQLAATTGSQSEPPTAVAIARASDHASAASAAADEAALAAEMSAIAAALQAQSALAAAMLACSNPTAVQGSDSARHMTPEGSDVIIPEAMGPVLAQPTAAVPLQSDSQADAGAADVLMDAVKGEESVVGIDCCFILQSTAAATDLEVPNAAFAAFEWGADSLHMTYCSSVMDKSGQPMTAWAFWADHTCHEIVAVGECSVDDAEAVAATAWTSEADESCKGNAAARECCDDAADVTVTAVTGFTEPGSIYAPANVDDITPGIAQAHGYPLLQPVFIRTGKPSALIRFQSMLCKVLRLQCRRNLC